MPTPRASRSGDGGPLLKTWRQERLSGGRATVWLIIRRAVATLLVGLLVGWLAYLVFGPMLRPKTYLLYWSADDLDTIAAPPLEFVYEDFGGFVKLKEVVSPLPPSEAALQYESVTNRRRLDDLLSELAAANTQGRDVVILYLAAHGVVRDGKPLLMCNEFDPGSESVELFDLEELVTRLDRINARTKLLLLDAGRHPDVLSLGQTPEAFGNGLEQLMADADASSVTVLTANAPGERSHVSHALRRSVFAYFAALGLQGAADTNEDESVNLRELADFVRVNVGNWVHLATDGHQSQTPQLLGGGVSQDSGPGPFLASAAGLETPLDKLSIETEIGDAQDPEARQGWMAATAEFLKTELRSFGSKTYSQIEKLTDGDDEQEAEQLSSDEQQAKDRADRAATQAEQELALLASSWRLSEQVEKRPASPIDYAPHLWKTHVEQLLWRERRQQSGELTSDVQGSLAGGLRSVQLSLEGFLKPETPRPETPGNVIDRIWLTQPTAPEIDDAPTLALLEAVAETNGGTLASAELAEFLTAYDGWLESADDGADFRQVREKLWNAAWARFYELELLEGLSADPELSQQVVKQALLVRRVGEKVATDPLWARGWAAQTVDQADRLRLEAERLLRDKAARDWKQRTSWNLQRALSLYRAAEKELAVVRQATHLQRALLNQLADFIRWRRLTAADASSKAPTPAELESLCRALADLQSTLAAPEQVELDAIETQRKRVAAEQAKFQNRLTTQVADLANEPFKPGDAWRIDLLLNTALLTSADRTRCLEQRVEAEKTLMGDFEFNETRRSAAAGTSSTRSQTAEYLRLESLRLEAFAPAEFGAGGNLAGGTDQSEQPAALQMLRKRFEQLPRAIDAAVATNAGLGDVATRPQRLRALRRAADALHLLPSTVPADAIAQRSGAAGRDSLPQRLNAARWYDLFAAARARRLRAEQDAPTAEAAMLKRQAQQFARLADAVENQPPLPTYGPARLAVQANQTNLSLLTERQQSVVLTVKSLEASPIWIVAQYDDRLLDVRGDGTSVIAEHDVRQLNGSEEEPDRLGYPYQPAARQVAETFSLAAGESRDNFRLLVNRREGAQGDTTLVLKAVGRDAHVRREIPIQLPRRTGFALSLSDGRSVRPIGDDPVYLYPNASQDFLITATKTAGKPQQLLARLYAPRRDHRETTLADGAVGPVDAARIRQRFRCQRPFASAEPVSLSQNGAPVPLAFLFDGAAGGAAANGADEEVAAEPLPHGLLLEVVDEEAGKHTFRRLQFKVHQPRTYLDARAQYNPGNEQLNVTLRARDPARMPPGVVRAELQIDRRFLSAREGGRSGTGINRSGEPSTLTALLNGSWPRDYTPLAEAELRAYVRVNGYPRAFEFHIPRANRITDLEPVWDTTDIRIVEPTDAAEFPETPHVDAVVEVDVPPRVLAAGDETNMIRVGVDEDRSRNFNSSEEVVVLPGDRRVAVFAQPTEQSGSLALRSAVDDFRLRLPTAGINQRRVYLLGEIAPPAPAERTYRHVEIALDGSPPEIGTVRLAPRGATLRVELNPTDLTGVKSVEAGFESADEITWKKGKRLQGGAWLVELETKELPADEHTVLIRTADEVGNQTEQYRRERWVKREAEPTRPRLERGAAADPDRTKPTAPAVKNRLSGRVTYGSQPVTKIKVTVAGPGGQEKSAKISAGQRFDFGMLSPGTYALAARGLSRNLNRSKEMQVTVSDQPNTPTEIEVEIR